MIGYALQIQRHQNKVTCSSNRLGVFGHELDELAKNRAIQAIDFVVLLRDLMCDAGVMMRKGVEGLAQHFSCLRSHERNIDQQLQLGLMGKVDRYLRDVAGMVADPFQVDDDVEHGCDGS